MSRALGPLRAEENYPDSRIVMIRRPTDNKTIYVSYDRIEMVPSPTHLVTTPHDITNWSANDPKQENSIITGSTVSEVPPPRLKLLNETQRPVLGRSTTSTKTTNVEHETQRDTYILKQIIRYKGKSKTYKVLWNG